MHKEKPRKIGLGTKRPIMRYSREREILYEKTKLGCENDTLIFFYFYFKFLTLLLVHFNYLKFKFIPLRNFY